ncbi:Hypothetical protein CAP_4207 [Chondromyces apiculatus DSM 436]|uniref:DUF6748 domain-containing protein n=1 Tax=Chondromyces apiculatus DSM 436 TaxID=1192034 RepID=A0A017T810_9BACT|nr:Hypothetical protein CAP_4207 [Chondromyces apiculatus DSM 436]
MALLGISSDAKAAPTSSGGEDEVRDETFYVVTAVDVRRCAQPYCGGYFVSEVNQKRTRCVDGTYAASCYVAAIDLFSLGVSNPQEASLRQGNTVFYGSIVPRDDVNRPIGDLVVEEAWAGLTAGKVTSTLFHVENNGLQCIAAPCPSYDMALLNSEQTSAIHEVDLSGAAGTDAQKGLAMRQLLTGAGVLVEGRTTIKPDAGPAGDATVLAARQVYIPVVRDE